METLTKENFWNEVEQKYPKAMKHFKEWVDRYKSEHDWDVLFNTQHVDMKLIKELADYGLRISPKYHDLPIAMQFGIFLEYTYELATKPLYAFLITKKNRGGQELLKVEYGTNIRTTIEWVFRLMEEKL